MVMNLSLTIGLSGSLGSVITKFFSMRSSVVAKSIPWRMSLSLPAPSQLSDSLTSLVIKTSGSTVGGGASRVPAKLTDFGFNLQENHHTYH